MPNVIELKHTTDTGHRIPNHQGGAGKCARLHGHTYQFTVELTSEDIDEASGMLLDYGIIKEVLNDWDHRTLLWQDDDLRLDALCTPLPELAGYNQAEQQAAVEKAFGIIRVPWIPTAESMARHLAQLFVLEFEAISFATVTVKETGNSAARHWCAKEDASRGRAKLAAVT